MTQGVKYKLQPRLLKGFRDIFPETYLARQWMIEKVKEVYERYGFSPLETPALEYLDNLGKHIQETDSAAEGIYSFRDEEEEWIALRYDLTAPLSRVVAQYGEVTRPYRRYQVGPVWREEKPGVGRFREFYQFDIDIVGTKKMAADAEICCCICDCMENLGFARGEYLVRVNNRKILSGLLESSGIEALDKKGSLTDKSLSALRAIDKLDRLGMPAVIELLGKGRKDESGDFTRGAELSNQQIETLEKYLNIKEDSREQVIDALAELIGDSTIGQEGVSELREIDEILSSLGFGTDCITFDPAIVRGLAYYTGPVFETGLVIPEQEDHPNFGSVFSGGRYDGLVERFLGVKVPATGASIGLDRLLEALKALGKLEKRKSTAQVFITTIDKTLTAEYHKIARELRDANINTDVFMGKGGLKKQLKYADKWEIPIAIILGSNELESNEVSIKDLYQGKEMAKTIESRDEWKEQPAQIAIARDKMIETVKEMLARYQS